VDEGKQLQCIFTVVGSWNNSAEFRRKLKPSFLLLKWFSCKYSQEENIHMFMDFKMTYCHRLFLHDTGGKNIRE
jgi:hypothetical protein